MANAIRICKTEGSLCGDNVFDISRPNILSNPFTHIKDKKTLAKRVVKDKETAIKLYSEYFDKMVEKEGKFKDEFDRMYDSFLANETIYIACYCKTDDICHGDIIIDRLNRRLAKEKINELLRKKD